jgi:hypothetical protein
MGQTWEAEITGSLIVYLQEVFRALLFLAALCNLPMFDKVALDKEEEQEGEDEGGERG